MLNERAINHSLEISRRNFISSTGAAAASLAMLQSKSVQAADPPPKIDLGLIGCGGRGGWIADLFQKNGSFNLVAVADYFPDRANAVGDRFQIPATRRFKGLSAYRRLLDERLDAVVIQSPPYFHPEHA